MTKSLELYVCVCVKEFSTQALLRLRPELNSMACIVMDGDPPLQQVCSLNMKARLLGLAHGMTKTEVDTFPSMTILRRSRDEEARGQAVLLESVAAFSPRIEIKKEGNVFICVLDIAGTEKLFGPPEILARSLVHRLKALGFVALATVSRNFHAAITWRRGFHLATRSKSSPRIRKLLRSLLCR